MSSRRSQCDAESGSDPELRFGTSAKNVIPDTKTPSTQKSILYKSRHVTISYPKLLFDTKFRVNALQFRFSR